MNKRNNTVIVSIGLALATILYGFIAYGMIEHVSNLQESAVQVEPTSKLAMRDRAVVIYFKAGDTYQRGGSGYLIDGNSVLTAKHVADAQLIKERGAYIILNGKIVKVASWNRSKNGDMAIGTLEQSVGKFAMATFKHMKETEIYFSYGYPMFGYWRIPDSFYKPGSERHIKVLFEDGAMDGKVHKPLLVYTAFKPVLEMRDQVIGVGGLSKIVYYGIMPHHGPGMSGSPILDVDGQIVGVFIATNTNEQGAGIAVPVQVESPEFFKYAEND